MMQQDVRLQIQQKNERYKETKLVLQDKWNNRISYYILDLSSTYINIFATSECKIHKKD